ncbi:MULTISPECIES: nucleoside 2-deoxyribosyltransferase domain-containing protein [unclassified Clostridioides]|uniref:nucleoside 2-deoxyribosyltransferase domain-containing protein n=1 Tax=unclassified Clostridioides TaxID=2635829 RepID=UPI001D0CC4C8|nr:hypothetical protein [Clostridioides sp. ES-S-0049-03]MCC0677905.1 hypothetical protein [Clostridioides sp. ES-W-0018-02]MCC0712670.1 hypothetical protein [Clostridioides sp. ES-W-0017-02]MCC0765083.1 hypothetical protein [Clostridioides sp. ES-S-0006-03]
MKVFLGGTCNESTWRDELISLLEIDYYNPVVPNWTEECMEKEREQRKTCDYCLYTITPLMTGVYSIAEAVEDSIKRPHKTIFCLYDSIRDEKKFTISELKSLNEVGNMVKRNGGKYFTNLLDTALYLNKKGEY